MLKPSKMTKVRLIVSKEYYDRVLSALQDLGTMQIESVGEQALRFMKSGEGVDYKEVSELAQRFRGLESLLYRQATDRMFSFESMRQLEESAASIRIDGRVAAIRRELDGVSADLKEARGRLALLGMMKQFGGDLSVLNSKSMKSFVAHGRELRAFSDSVISGVGDAVIITMQSSAIVSIRKEAEKDFGAIAERKKVVLEVVPELRGSVAEQSDELGRRVERLSSTRNGLEAELQVISEKWYPLVSALREQLDIEMEKYEIMGRIGIGASIAALEGWIPSGNTGRMEKLVGDITEGHFVTETISTDELPPTRLDNPALTRLFEFFIRFYSLPRSDEIDPTLIFALVFPIFFGFMVGDFGYGLIMLIGSLWLIRRLKHPPKKSRIPKKLSGFVTMIVSPSGLNILARAIIPGSIISMVLGIAFNEYLGFQLPYTALFNVETGLPTLLVLSGYIGVFMVEFGFILGFINRMSHHERKHAIAKLGWFVAALGIVIFGLNVLHKAQLGPANLLAVASYAMIAVGIGAVLYGEGSQSLMEVPSIVSHILSYVRLIGILLTSVILAGIIDMIFLNGVQHSLLMAIVGTVILVFGQIFNLVIAIFESGIQGARLIYVEFFSKFFSGNGVAFRPFKSSRKRTLSRFDLA